MAKSRKCNAKRYSRLLLLIIDFHISNVITLSKSVALNQEGSLPKGASINFQSGVNLYALYNTESLT